MATRAQVDAARSKGGKPRDANRIAGRTAAQDVYEGGEGSATASDGSTVARGPDGQVYRYNPKYDYTTIERADGSSSAPMRGNQLPGGMNNYIDKVLEMSGMNDGAQSSASAAPSNVPVPTPRPDAAAVGDGVPSPDTAIPTPTARPNMDEVANSDAATFGEAVAGLLGGAGAGAAAAYLTRGGAGKAKSAIDSTIDAIDGDADTETAPDMRGEAAQLEAEKRAALPAPQGKLPAPSNVDTMIDAVDGAPTQPVERGAALPAPPLALTDADAPYSPRNPMPDVAASTAPSRAEVLQQIVGMPPRQAITALRQAGIDLNTLAPDELRILAEASNSLRTGARQAASDAVSSAVRGAAR